MKTEPIKIPSPKGDIAAVVHRPDELTDKLAILCPGYLDSKDYDHLVGLAHDLTAKGYTVARFDPIGTWESGGEIADYTTGECLENMKAVLEYMLKARAYKQILAGGHSRGGFIAMLYALREPRISAALAIMPPCSLIRRGNEWKMEEWKKTGFKTSKRDVPNSSDYKTFTVPYSQVLEGAKFNVLEEIGQLKVPVVLVAGELDRVITPAEVESIYQQANEPKQLIVLPGIGHDYRHRLEEIKKVNEQILASLYI